jgi:hypothetical protein
MPGKQVRKSDVAWAAGLFEGEGCLPRNQGTIGAPHYPSAALAMSDEDVVRAFRGIVNMGSVYQERHPASKTMYRWKINGFEKTQALIGMFWPWLGSRRRDRATEMLRLYEPGRHMGRINAAKTHCPGGHPYDSANTYSYRGGRQCRACHAIRERGRRERSQANL